MNRLDVVEQIITCEACELHKHCTSPVAFSAPSKTDSGILVLGEAPGAIEDKQGKPFVGPAGTLMRTVLSDCGIDPETVWFANTISCYPNEFKNPDPRHIISCADNRRAQIQASDARWVLAVGKIALNTQRPDVRISTAHGRVFQPGGTGPVWFCTFHPSAALQNPLWEQDLRTDVHRFAGIVEDFEWQRNIDESCWECGDRDLAWVCLDWSVWCRKHLPTEARNFFAKNGWPGTLKWNQRQWQ